MGNEEPSGQQAVEHCPRCGSVVENAAGIGPFCPNAKCDVADNLLCVPTFSTAAPTAPSTAAGEPALVCGCGWEGSYADLNETAEGMTCPKCRLSRNLDCAATPPAQESNPFRAAMHDAYVASEGGVTWHEDDPKQTLGEIVAWTMNFIDAATPEPSVPQPGLELDRAMDAALLRSAKIIDMPWEEQAAQIRREALEEAARCCQDARASAQRNYGVAEGFGATMAERRIRALLYKPAKGDTTNAD